MAAKFQFKSFSVDWFLGDELKDHYTNHRARCIYVHADHRELDFIRNYFTGIRGCDCGTGPQIWVGEEADFIYRNIRISPATTQYYHKWVIGK